MGHFSQEDLNKLNDRTPGGGGQLSDWFRPGHDKNSGKDRKYKIRLLPVAGDDPYPFFFERMHMFYGEDYISGVCPQAYGDGGFCPACDIFFTLWNTPELSDESNKGLLTSLKKLGPDQRAYANVYDYESEAVKAWSIAYGARKQLDSYIEGLKEFGVIATDPEDGRDCVINMTKLGKNSKVSGVTPDPNASAVPAANWVEELKDLKVLAHQRELTVDELETAIVAQLGEHYEILMEIYEKHKKPAAVEEPIGEKV